MEHALNKVILIVLAILLSYWQGIDIYTVLPVLIAITISFAYDIFHKRMNAFLTIVFLLSCIVIHDLIFFMPLIIYDIYTHKLPFYVYLPFVAIALIGSYPDFVLCLFTMIFMGFGIIIKNTYIRGDELLKTYRKQRDSTREVSILMEERNHDLLLRQDYEVRLATLNERNRIAREIHDNVGHLLSSSLLQVGAVQTINDQDNLNPSLQNIKETLSDAMDSVRKSVHNLHDDSLHLEMEVRKLIEQIKYCNVRFEYDIASTLSTELIYHILSILKEAINNIMKHSNATQVEIILREQKKFYQLIVADNGTKIVENSIGIGLHNIAQRVDQYHGYLNISKEHGYRIFITLPKEEVA